MEGNNKVELQKEMAKRQADAKERLRLMKEHKERTLSNIRENRKERETHTNYRLNLRADVDYLLMLKKKDPSDIEKLSWKERIDRYYKAGAWSDARLKEASGKIITSAEAKEITGDKK